LPHEAAFANNFPVARDHHLAVRRLGLKIIKPRGRCDRVAECPE